MTSTVHSDREEILDLRDLVPADTLAYVAEQRRAADAAEVNLLAGVVH